MATTPLLQTLQGYLKVATDRQQIVASNIANIDTPGFHARDINFQSAMQQAMSETTIRRLGSRELSKSRACRNGPTATT